MSELLDQLASAPLPTPGAIAAELEAELKNLVPVKPRTPARQIATLVGISLVYGAGLLAVLTMRHDMTELPTAWILGAGTAWLLGFVVPCYLALVPKPGSMMTRWPIAAIAACIASVAFITLGMIVHPSGPTSLHYGWEHFGRGHWCLELGLATAFVPVVVGAIFLRGALPVNSRWIAASLGAGGGCLGGLLLHLHCRIADGPHIGVIHGGVVLVAALLSALLVPRSTDRPLR